MDMYYNALPDSTLINEVLISVSEIDSFRKDYKILDKITIPLVYKFQKWENDTMPPPPPPPESISYDDLFYFFHDDSINQKRLDDSTFISLQVDTLRKFNVPKSLAIQFDDESYRYYRFNIPIFSYDKNAVMVMYWRVCGGLCGNCHIVLLNKIDGKWTKIDSWGCGIM
jgi:hypothetical protein